MAIKNHQSHKHGIMMAIPRLSNGMMMATIMSLSQCGSPMVITKSKNQIHGEMMATVMDITGHHLLRVMIQCGNLMATTNNNHNQCRYGVLMAILQRQKAKAKPVKEEFKWHQPPFFKNRKLVTALQALYCANTHYSYSIGM